MTPRQIITRCAGYGAVASWSLAVGLLKGSVGEALAALSVGLAVAFVMETASR